MADAPSLQRLRQTISCGALNIAVLAATDMAVGFSLYDVRAEAIDRKTDGVLLSAIVVTKQDGRPGSGFFPYALREGLYQHSGAIHRRPRGSPEPLTAGSRHRLTALGSIQRRSNSGVGERTRTSTSNKAH